MHLGFAKEVGKSLRHDDAVFQGIAGAGRSLGAVGDDPPLAVWRARQIDSEQVEVGGPGDRNVMAGAPESRIAEDQRGRKIPIQQQLLWTVKIGQDGVEQAGALDQARFEIAPFRRRDKQRDRIQAPRAVGAQRIAIDVVADAVFPDTLACDLPAMSQFLTAERGQRSDVAIPVGAKHARLHAHLVVNARGLAVVGGQ